MIAHSTKLKERLEEAQTPYLTYEIVPEVGHNKAHLAGSGFPSDRSPTAIPTKRPIAFPSPTHTRVCETSKADADCNGRVDLVDFEIWRQNFRLSR